jgi:hypothetical protein
MVLRGGARRSDRPRRGADRDGRDVAQGFFPLPDDGARQAIAAGALHPTCPRRGTATRPGGHSHLPAGSAAIWSLSYRTHADAMPVQCLSGDCGQLNPPSLRTPSPNCRGRTLRMCTRDKQCPCWWLQETPGPLFRFSPERGGKRQVLVEEGRTETDLLFLPMNASLVFLRAHLGLHILGPCLRFCIFFVFYPFRPSIGCLATTVVSDAWCYQSTTSCSQKKKVYHF